MSRQKSTWSNDQAFKNSIKGATLAAFDDQQDQTNSRSLIIELKGV